MNFFEEDTRSALEAKEEAQRIAMAPVVFQASRVLRDRGILECIAKSKSGLMLEEIADQVNLPLYGVRVLLEAGLGIGLLIQKEDSYFLTKTGSFILNDTLTRINMDFVHDVCYKGMYHLEESIRHGKPEGLKVFGDWPTIYEGLSKLPPNVQKSWFAFDHFYSDYAFPELLPVVFERKPATLLDIGGNTGKWALQCVAYNPDVRVTIMDLHGQVEMAKAQIEQQGVGNRVRFHECNILNEAETFPDGFDAIWMSQFLDCFSEEQIVSIVSRCRQALSDAGQVYILEPFWDRQRFKASAFVLQQTSLYFTAMANGNSQMYHSDNLIRCVEKAGFRVVGEKDQVGVSHTLLICRPA